MDSYLLVQYPASREELVRRARINSSTTLRLLSRFWQFVMREHTEKKSQCIELSRISAIARGEPGNLQEWDHFNACPLGCNTYRLKLSIRFKKEEIRRHMQTQLGVDISVDISSTRLI